MTNNSIESAKKKRSLISLPFIILCVVVLGVGYYRGEWIMVQLMYFQEQYIAYSNHQAAKKASLEKYKNSSVESGTSSEGDLMPPDDVAGDSNTAEPASTNPPASSASETKTDLPSDSESK